MNVGELRKAIQRLDDELSIVVAAPIEDADGDHIEGWFTLQTVTRDMDADTTEWYARFECTSIDSDE
jgi:hypothetical protein